MANAGTANCSDLQQMLTTCTNGIKMYIGTSAVTGAGPSHRCVFPSTYEGYGFLGSGVDLNYDPNFQIFQTDPAAGYPAFAVWCDAADENSQTGVIIRQINADGTTQDFPGPVMPLPETNGFSASSVIPGTQCMLTFRFECKGSTDFGGGGGDF